MKKKKTISFEKVLVANSRRNDAKIIMRDEMMKCLKRKTITSRLEQILLRPDTKGPFHLQLIPFKAVNTQTFAFQ